jgi:hypothetical protein
MVLRADAPFLLRRVVISIAAIAVKPIAAGLRRNHRKRTSNVRLKSLDGGKPRAEADRAAPQRGPDLARSRPAKRPARLLD